MSIEIKRSDKYVDYNISATNNRGYITIDTSDWINKPWMFYELPALKFEIYTETNGELVKYQNFTREIRTYNPVYSPLGVLNVTIDIRNVPEEFILRITPIFDNNAVAARNMLVENGIEDGEIWGSDQDVPTQLFNLNLEFIECEGEYIPPTPPAPPTHEETITGVPPITFDGSTGEPLISWSMLGNGSQQGTPTPDNPIQPEFVGVRTGNLFDINATPTKYSQSTIVTVDGQTLTITGTWYIYYEIDVVPNTEYYVSWTIDYAEIEGRGTIAILTTSGQTIKNQSSSPFSFNSGENQRIRLNIYAASSTSGTVILSNIMLNLGSTALSYEPFGWAEKLTCAGQTVPFYLGQTQTVRKIRKLVLTGEENGWTLRSGTPADICFISQSNLGIIAIPNNGICNVAKYTEGASFSTLQEGEFLLGSTNFGLRIPPYTTTTEALRTFLRSMNAAGTPVVIWYVLANEQTGIVNEPLCKIGTYADELHSEDASVTIPTAKGSNTLTVDTDLQPSEMTITYTKEGQ